MYARCMSECSVIEIAGGLTVSATTKLVTDSTSMRALIESGVSYKDVAASFKLSVNAVREYAKREGWMTPTKINRLRREIRQKQTDVFKRTGKTTDIASIKAQIWQERAENIKERTHQIIEKALEGVTDEKASRMIQNPLGLMHITTVARLITGEEAEAAQAPKMAVNIAFLRGEQPQDAPIEV